MPVGSLVHIAAGALALLVGGAILALRKGDRRHKLLGRAYLAAMGVALAIVIARGAVRLTPFHLYAVLVAIALIGAFAAPRLRFPAWRAWHAALMSFSILGALVAVGGVVAGVALGVGTGPAFFRAFNLVIVGATTIGLLLIDLKIWRTARTPSERRARVAFHAATIVATAAIVVAQA